MRPRLQRRKSAGITSCIRFFPQSLILSMFRSTRTSGEAMRYLDSIARLRPKVSETQKNADQAVRYQRLISTGDPENALLVIKEIWEKEKSLKKEKRKLTQADVKYRRIAEKLVCEEFAVTLNTGPESIKRRVYEAMERETPKQ